MKKKYNEFEEQIHFNPHYMDGCGFEFKVDRVKVSSRVASDCEKQRSINVELGEKQLKNLVSALQNWISKIEQHNFNYFYEMHLRGEKDLKWWKEVRKQYKHIKGYTGKFKVCS